MNKPEDWTEDDAAVDAQIAPKRYPSGPDETTRIGWMQARVLNRIQARIQAANVRLDARVAGELIMLRNEIRADMDLAPTTASRT